MWIRLTSNVVVDTGKVAVIEFRPAKGELILRNPQNALLITLLGDEAIQAQRTINTFLDERRADYMSGRRDESHSSG